MSNMEISAKPETKRGRELTLGELDTVSGGKGKAGGSNIYLVFKFKLVAVKTVS